MYIRAYADALACADRASAAATFREWMTSASAVSTDALDSLAGLQLFGGDRVAAEKLIADLRLRPDDTHSPDRLGELGWWYYRAGDSQRALTLLDDAAQQRPSRLDFLVNDAWSAIDQRRFAQALGSLQNAGSLLPNLRTLDSAEVSMASAVAFWLSEDRDSAVREYRRALELEPAWQNSLWIERQYSPLVAHTVSELSRESERRKKATEQPARQAQ